MEGWACQMGRSHEGPDVEGDYEQLRVTPRQPQPAYQTGRYRRRRDRRMQGRSGDSSTRRVLGARDEVGCRKGDEASAWERKGWCEAHGQGQIERRSKIHTERLEPKYGPWVGCNPQSRRRRNCQPAQDEREKSQCTRWKD